MKKLLLCLVLLLPFLAGAQTGKFTITGKISALGAKTKIYLAYRLGANKVLDSALVTGGNFLLSGELLYPTNATLLLDHTGAGMNFSPDAKFDALNLYLDKGNMTITGTDSITTAKITGSPINDDNARLTARLSSVNARINKLTAETNATPYAKQNTLEFQNDAQAKRKALQTEQEEILKGYIKGNPNSYLSLMTLSSLGGPSADPAVIEPLYNALSPELKQTEAAKSIVKAIADLKLIVVGAMAPDFTQPDAGGIPIKLSSYRGKYVLIDFWASWCIPCRLEHPNMTRAFNKYRGKKFTILGVSLDPEEKKIDWLNAIELDGLTWTQVSDLKEWGNTAAALYFVRSIPQNYLIDPTGKIIGKNLRGADLDNKLAEIFGKI